MGGIGATSNIFGGGKSSANYGNVKHQNHSDYRQNLLKKTSLFSVNPNVFQPAAARD